MDRGCINLINIGYLEIFLIFLFIINTNFIWICNINYFSYIHMIRIISTTIPLANSN